MAVWLDAGMDLPCLKVTIAPESVTEDQVIAMHQARILVSLGHSDADHKTRLRYISAGARCVIHLFDAMSRLDKREPFRAGAALDCQTMSAGVSAGSHHVHPAALRLA